MEDDAERADGGRHDFWWAIQWVARVLTIVMVSGFALIGLSELARGGAPVYTPRDAFWFALFPIGVCVGYLIAWRREFPGAMVSVACLALLYAGGALVGQRPPAVPFLWPFGGPALLFLCHWALAPDERLRRAARR
jgi:hypothetical protein